MHFVRFLKSSLFKPDHLRIVGSLFDFAGPAVSLRYRKALFRLLGALLAASYHRRATGISRTKAMIGGSIAGLLYRLRIHGIENLPNGGFLLVANHMGIFDTILLQLAIPRPVRIIARKTIYDHPWLNPILNLMGGSAIPLSPGQTRKAIRESAACIKNGEIVCVYPEGELNRTGLLLRLQSGFELISRVAGCDVIPVWLDDLRNSFFSFERGKQLLEFRTKGLLSTMIAFGQPIPSEECNNGVVRQKLLELSEFCFEAQPEVGLNLARAIVYGLKPHPFADAYVDARNGRRVQRGELLATGIALSRWIKRNCLDKRIALALSGSADRLVANLAVTLASKVPVSPEAGTSGASMDRSDLFPWVLTSAQMPERPTDFLGSKAIHVLDEVIFRLRCKVFFWRMICHLAPAGVLCHLLKVPREGGNHEAAIYIKNSASSDAIGIVRSHGNIMSSVLQWRSVLRLKPGESLLAFAFSEGEDSTLALWYPVTQGVPLVLNSESDKTKEHSGLSFLAAVPPFATSSSLHAKAEELGNAKILALGSGEAGREFCNAFMKKFGQRISTGYRLAEGISVISINLPEPVKTHSEDNLQLSFRPGSVGKLLPGLVAEIRHPKTGAILSPYQTGALWLRSATISEGHLDQQNRKAETLRDGWFHTGELARFDEDGFLYIEQAVPAGSEINPLIKR